MVILYPNKSRMVVFPNAKINIGLRIIVKRTDGYHDIETVFYPVKLYDALEFVPADQYYSEDQISVTGIDTGSSPKDNLVMKAIRLLREKHNFPVTRMHLHKAIPAGAGLGGGSADASCLIKAVNRFFSLGISDEELSTIALGIGSDCPFFIDNVPAFATGRGEVLNTVPEFLKGYYIILLNPGVHISTKEAYGNCVPSKPSTSLKELVNLPVEEWKGVILNDFEDFAMKKHPVIREIKDSLYNSGALFSLMSGSGSCVFGIFREKPEFEPVLRRYVIYEGLI